MAYRGALLRDICSVTGVISETVSSQHCPAFVGAQCFKRLAMFDEAHGADRVEDMNRFTLCSSLRGDFVFLFRDAL